MQESNDSDLLSVNIFNNTVKSFKTTIFCLSYEKHETIIKYLYIVFTPHACPVLFWPSRHNFRDTQLKFSIFSLLSQI